MIDVSFSFAWNPEFWGFGWTLTPTEGNTWGVPEFSGNNLGIRFLCLGMDISFFSR